MAVAAPFADRMAQTKSRHIDDAEAQRISNKIDEELKAEREQIRRRKNQKRDVKVMLLGQAESGKSTLQKQFQLYYASNTLDRERPAWRPVVHFNIIKAVRMILEELDFTFSQSSQNPQQHHHAHSRSLSHHQHHFSPSPLSASPRGSPPHHAYSPNSPDTPANVASGSGSKSASVAFASGSGSGTSGSANSTIAGGWPDDLSALRTKLLPLVAVEDALASDLSGGVSVAGGRTGVFVRAGWQALVSPALNRAWAGATGRGNPGAGAGTSGPAVNDLVARMLAAMKDEVESLWRHPNVRALVKYRKLRLEESASFFLESMQRIAEPDYLPSTEDILNVRLQTLGVKEHSFDISLSGTRVNWLLYDVGGARGQRHAWVPFFDDATAIIFLAPISAFDQYLEEDPRTNRIDDSLQLFTAICQNKLLKNTHLVLMLNKTDLLKQKLSAGIKVRKYITSYGDRPNNYEEVSEYFRAHFLQVHRRNDISKRALYAHFTSMLDIKATQKIIVNVGEAIIRSYIADAGLT